MHSRLLLIAFFFLGAGASYSAELKEGEELFRTGKYRECLELADKAVEMGSLREEWTLLLVNAQLTLGEYADARTSIDKALRRYPSSIRLRMLGHHVYRFANEPTRSREMLEEVNELGGSRIWAYRDPPNLVALGQAALLLGAEPKLVLENVFERAKKTDPSLRDSYLAIGELALGKNDFQLAAKTFEEGLKQFSNDPDMLYGMARAYADSDRLQMVALLSAALKQNPKHAPSLLRMADHLIDSESYDGAEESLKKVLDVNAHQPEAWAYRAVIAHLRHDATGEAAARDAALGHWKTNPTVDHLIGRKLSQKYRFKEGAAAQRRALDFDPKFVPAKIQLAQDLLRLGDEDDGWRLAEEVHKADGYDVEAYNLVTLHETIEKFATVTNEHFIVRMSRYEAAVYGDRALALLERARSTLAPKFGVQLERQTMVEIFPEQKDFGVRTFGMPDNPGFLGVCFGPVITANSPASQTANPANWEAVLWHEFCHVLTLSLTKNKMPRWFSEGISVYEERLANPVWGQSMTPEWRARILDNKLTPVSQLSAAFLKAEDGEDLQFAYFESALVVEFLVEQFGFEKLTAILRDLGDGTPINDALVRHTSAMDKIEKEFVAFARKRAEALGPNLDWTELERDEVEALESELPEKFARNYYALLARSRHCVEEKQWDAAKTTLLKLLELAGETPAAERALTLLAAVHRNLNESDAERQTLRKLVAMQSDSVDVFARLAEMAVAAKDWSEAATNAQRHLAVNPLVALPHRILADASEKLDDVPTAIAAYGKVLLLDPPDPSNVHFRLARLLKEKEPDRARRHVLQALEEAPRFREAHRLLLELEAKRQRKQSTSLPGSTFDTFVNTPESGANTAPSAAVAQHEQTAIRSRSDR